MSLGDRALKAVGWQSLAVVLQATLQMVVLFILARHVTPAEFGLVAIANIAIMFVTMLSQGIIRPAVIQRQHLTREYIRASFTLSVLLGCSLMLLLWVLAPLIAQTFSNREVIPILQMLSISFFINSLGVVAEGLLERELQFKNLLFANVGSYVLGYTPVGLTLALLGYGVWALVLGALAQSIFRNLFLLTLKPHPTRPYFARTETTAIIHFAGGLMLFWIFSYIALQADNFIIGRSLGSAALGIYAMAFTIMDMPRRYIGSVIEKVLLPLLSDVQTEPLRLAKMFYRSIGALGMVMMPVSIILVMLTPELIQILLGENWLDAVVPLQILLLQIPFRTCIRTSDALVMAKAVMYGYASRRAIYPVLVIIGAWYGHFWGLSGVAVGVTLAVMFNFIMSVGFALGQISGSWRGLVSALLPGFLLSTVIFLVTGAAVLGMRELTNNPLLTVCVVMLGAMISVLGLVFSVPAIIGEPGNWLVQVVSSKLKKNSRLKMLLGHLLRNSRKT
jgi:PST family polysaccharide transporter